VLQTQENVVKAHFIVDIETDSAAIEREGKRHGYSLERAREAILADLECRLHDGG